MADFTFILSLAGLLIILVCWSFKHLPQEQWQILGAIPLNKRSDGTWQGINFTYYGLLTANACVLAIILLFILLASAGIQTSIIFLVTMMVFSICIPSSRLIAMWVEHKPFTASVGGAFFVGLLVIPCLLLLIQYIIKPWSETQLPVMTVLAAIGIAYAFGEGIGRLACISFGCCYGKPVANLTPFFQKLMRPFCFVYYGETKKIFYADGLCGQKIVPVPAFTVLICSLTGLVGIALFLNDRHPAVIIFFQVLWLGVFFHAGKSNVTEAILSFHVIKERI